VPDRIRAFMAILLRRRFWKGPGRSRSRCAASFLRHSEMGPARELHLTLRFSATSMARSRQGLPGGRRGRGLRSSARAPGRGLGLSLGEPAADPLDQHRGSTTLTSKDQQRARDEMGRSANESRARGEPGIERRDRPGDQSGAERSIMAGIVHSRPGGRSSSSRGRLRTCGQALKSHLTLGECTAIATFGPIRAGRRRSARRG